ncbi:MAG: antibiotic biosynthesis monooxygenase [unclassified Hahellaceae]|nr:antibiotic biosynthesis monooxygenase [Hahellaceae bacterium]|tara:strand:- start:185001 stop:185303 length:303 start_codon:yes stop_codon:yes gene_type:complete
MIFRIWKGWASKENASDYETLFRDVVLPKVTAGIDGYKGVNLLRREVNDEIEFTTIFRFDTLDAIKSFAGPDFERAVVPSEVKALLSRFEIVVQHHEVIF